MKNILTSVFALLVLAGCAQQSFVLENEYDQRLRFVKAQPFFVGGVGQFQTIDASKICGSGSKVVKVQVVQDPVDVALSIATLGIFTPRNAKVYCSVGTMHYQQPPQNPPAGYQSSSTPAGFVPQYDNPAYKGLTKKGYAGHSGYADGQTPGVTSSNLPDIKGMQDIVPGWQGYEGTLSPQY